MKMCKYSGIFNARNGVGTSANACANQGERRKPLTPGQRAAVIDQLQAGRHVADIAFSVGCNRDQVYRVRAALAKGQERLL